MSCAADLGLDPTTSSAAAKHWGLIATSGSVLGSCTEITGGSSLLAGVCDTAVVATLRATPTKISYF